MIGILEAEELFHIFAHAREVAIWMDGGKGKARPLSSFLFEILGAFAGRFFGGFFGPFFRRFFCDLFDGGFDALFEAAFSAGAVF